MVQIFLKLNSNNYIGTFRTCDAANLYVYWVQGVCHETSNLYIYWVHDTGIECPILVTFKNCLKRRLRDDKNANFWMKLGFRNSGCSGPNFSRP